MNEGLVNGVYTKLKDIIVNSRLKLLYYIVENMY